MTPRLSRATGALAALVLGAATLSLAPAAQALPATETFDIRVELDLPSSERSEGPAVFEVDDVVPGPGPELTGTHLVSNPSEWGGHINVDIDPATQTIRVGDNPEGWDFETARVRIESSSMGPLTIVSDELFTTSDPVNLALDAGRGWAEAFWTATDVSDGYPYLRGTSVFTWESLPQLTSVTEVEKASYIRRTKKLTVGATVTGEELPLPTAEATPVQGKARVVVLRGTKGTKRVAGKTVTLSAKGGVRATFKKYLAPGRYRVKVTYLGSESHASSVDTLGFRVRAVRTTPPRRQS